ncbi:MAG TPA: DNA starvation/stationary phase protection protein [Candidatus Eisenbacteria bacterium]|nr:DNA starvation/stationary phase protection protein [Candidatus Eisenbacteria bacterium]
MKPNLGLSDKQREAVLDILDATLADEFLLYTKTRNFHWNVTGSDFSELHKFFEAQYEALDETMDETAERARSLGGIALGSMEDFLKHARLKEAPAKALAAEKMLASLLADHEALTRSLRKDVDACTDQHRDAGTADFLTGLMERHEKMAWMLRSYLQ